jgi:hypothetical protein
MGSGFDSQQAGQGAVERIREVLHVFGTQWPRTTGLDPSGSQMLHDIATGQSFLHAAHVVHLTARPNGHATLFHNLSRHRIYDLATCQFVRDRRDVLWLGPPGTGKSHMSQAIGLAAIRSGFTVYYRSIFDCVRDFLHDEAMEGHERILGRYLKPDLLIIDDMGMKQLPKRSGEYLFEVVMRRHELRSTMTTSNRPLEDWGKLIGDVPSATAILDRFLHRSETIQITGRSYRLDHGAGIREKTSNSTKVPTGSPSDK